MLNATWFVLAGMAIVFGTLSLLALAMIALNRWLAPGSPATARSGRQPGTGNA